MIRTQIQLTEQQHRTLRELARRRGVSMSELIRMGVDRLSADAARERRWEQARALVGHFASRATDTSTRHDSYLTAAFRR